MLSRTIQLVPLAFILDRLICYLYCAKITDWRWHIAVDRNQHGYRLLNENWNYVNVSWRFVFFRCTSFAYEALDYSWQSIMHQQVPQTYQTYNLCVPVLYRRDFSSKLSRIQISCKLFSQFARCPWKNPTCLEWYFHSMANGQEMMIEVRPYLNWY
jgi:hypothetical protein